jgi:hypothetical protein
VAYSDYGYSQKATVMKLGSGKPDTTTLLASDHNPATIGQSITFTATVSPSVATGTVTFKNSTADLGTVTLADGNATFSTTALMVGTHRIAAFYAGDGSYNGSSSSPLVQTIAALVKGDVNSDKSVNVFDALLTLQYSVGLHHPTDEAAFKAVSDVAPLDAGGKPMGDTVVNVFDALAILRHAVGLDVW